MRLEQHPGPGPKGRSQAEPEAGGTQSTIAQRAGRLLPCAQRTRASFTLSAAGPCGITSGTGQSPGACTPGLDSQHGRPESTPLILRVSGIPAFLRSRRPSRRPVQPVQPLRGVGGGRV